MSTDGAATPERPRGLAARYYTDSDVFAAELDRIFARSWVMVGHVSQVAERGTGDVHSENSVRHLQGLLLASLGDTA